MKSVDRRDRPPLSGPLARLAESAYRWGVARRNRRFDRGVGVRRFPIPIISVGNLSVGGTGKSPTVAMLVSRLRDLGRRPAVVMRGYKRRRGQASDEQAEYGELLPARTPVEADPDRCAAVDRLLTMGACDCAVLDDGFQHRRVARDLDIVLLDATRDPLDDRLLPAGWLREPVESLRRAHAVIITRADAADGDAVRRIEAGVRAVNASIVIARARHAWLGLESPVRVPSPSTGEASDTPRRTPSDTFASLRSRRTVIACAIGHPAAFIAQARTEGAEVLDTIVKPDHHHWTLGEVHAIADRARAAGAECVLTTMKDWVKLREHAGEAPETPWLVPRLAMVLTQGDAAFDELLRRTLRGAHAA